MSVNQGENIQSINLVLGNDFSTENLVERDSQYFYHQTLSTPVFKAISKVEGAYIFDSNGNKYLDLHGNGVHTVGYNNPHILEAIKKQISDGLTFSPRRFTNSSAVLLAEKMVEITPPKLSKVLFCPGGSQAIEMAIMLAKIYTGKWRTLSFYGTFHGAGFQAISVGADPHFREGVGPVIPGAIHLELPDYYRNPWGWSDQRKIDDEYIRQLEFQIEHNPGIAALISEPIFFNSTVPTPYYWENVKELCEKNGILLIFDEIYTAFGRTGKMFASEHFVEPDILVVGKGFGGGIVPFAGIIGKAELNIIKHKSIGHFTHEKSPFCSSIALAMIEYVEQYELVKRAKDLGGYFKDGLKDLKKEFELIGNISGLGLNLAVDLVKDQITKERATEKAHELMVFCLRKGVSFKLIQGNILNLKPALIITKKELDFILSTLRAGLQFISKK